ncbi:hypothetical protein L798_04409 [Zootermopsis nevadensis]|uniref:Uncharacterized protein n=1 Tax=Zootermopsis nevadensis TaxID=136037 RepID=A0A067RJG6_ZOONE|nr:hypothetical protein L798_04409 [Zootermopsis nevadensis]
MAEPVVIRFTASGCVNYVSRHEPAGQKWFRVCVFGVRFVETKSCVQVERHFITMNVSQDTTVKTIDKFLVQTAQADRKCFCTRNLPGVHVFLMKMSKGYAGSLPAVHMRKSILAATRELQMAHSTVALT